MEILERLNHALKLAGHKIGYSKKSEVAAFLGYKPGYYSGVINGKEKLSEDFLKRISDYLNINVKYVLYGVDPILNGALGSYSVNEDANPVASGQTVPYFVYKELLQKYEAVVRENEQLRLALTGQQKKKMVANL